MANGIHDVYTGQMQGVDPNLLQQIARAKSSGARLRGMNNSPAMATALRDYKTPLPEMQGKGLASTAPSWAEALGSIALRDRGDKRINAMEQEAAALRGDLTAGSIAEQQSALQSADYANKIDAQTRATTRANNIADQIAQEERALKRTLKAEERAAKEAAKKRVRVPFHDPEDPAKTLNLERNDVGQWFRGGKEVPATFVEGLTPYKAADSGSIGYKQQQAIDDKENEMLNKMLEVDLAGNVLTDTNLHSATGPWFDPVKQAATYGSGIAGTEDIQSTQTQVQALALKGAAPILAYLGKPTDRDLEEAFKAVPNNKSEPQVFLDWYEKTYTPAVISAFKNSDFKDQVPQLEQKMQKTLEQGYKVQYPEKYKERYGLSAANDAVSAAQAKVDEIKARMANKQ